MKLIYGFLLLIFSTCHAKDYGIIGQTFPVIEENLKTVIEKNWPNYPKKKSRERLLMPLCIQLLYCFKKRALKEHLRSIRATPL